MNKKRRMAALLAFALVSSGAAVARDADEYVAEAREFIAAGEYKAATIQLKNALRESPSDIDARLLLGSLHLKAGDGAAETSGEAPRDS